MNKKFMIGGCAAAVVAGNMVMAEDISYFAPYASLKAGYAFLGKRNDIKYKCGFAGAVELGVSYDAWRLGLELGFKSNKIKEVSNGINGNWVLLGAVEKEVPAGGAPATSAAAADYSIFKSGADIVGVTNAHWGLKNAMRLSKVNALTGMVNVCYDYAMTEAWSIYAGLGLGVAKVSYVFDRMLKNQIVDLDCNADAVANPLPATVKTAAVNALNNEVNSVGTKTEVSKTVFAWQLMAGVGYEFNENWKLTLGYKLFNTAKVKLFGDKKIKTPFNHTAELGLTYTF